MKALGVVTALACVAANANPASAQFALDLNSPLYGQDNNYYCGPASAQMIMQDYPDPADNSCFQQAYIYQRIQVHKTDSDFFTDPDGLRGAIMELNAPPAGSFLVFHDTDRDAVMHDMLYWMAEREYPSATLIYGGDHWVVVTGFEASGDPRTGNVVLNSININDPWPRDYAPQDNPCTAADEGNEGGAVRFVTGSSWYTYDWRDPNRYGTLYAGEYVAVVEPPEIEGRAVAEMQALRGEPIPPEEAIERALREIEERRLAERPSFDFLRQDVTATRALLTNRASGGYYVVVFELEETQLSPGAILINAYTGEFQEIGAFVDLLEYLLEEDAVEIALASVRREPDGPVRAELVFQSAEQIHSRYRPIWQVTFEVEDRPVVRYVDHLGQVFVELTPQPLGGD